METGAFSHLVQDEDGGREVFDGPLHRKPSSNNTAASQKKIFPTGAKLQGAKAPNGSGNTRTAGKILNRQGILFVIAIALAASICFSWTIWLILLNVAPNDTVNRVMNTKNFDYGSFWLMVDPSKAMVGVATFGLSVVAVGYFSVLVKMLPCVRRSKQAYLVHQATSRSLVEKVGKALNTAAESKTGSRVASSAARLAVTLTQQDSPSRKLLVRPRFTFDRAQFAINLEVFPAGWFEQGASVIANAEQVAIIYESLKSLRIMTAFNFFTRIGVNITLCIRLWKVVDFVQDPKKQRNSLYPKRHRFGAIVLVIYAVMLIIFVEESTRTSALACKPHPECVVKARRWTIHQSGSLTHCPCLMMIDRDTAPKTYVEWENPTNVTDKVAQLAAMGLLQTIQLTNRYLPVLPDELRLCKDLRHLCDQNDSIMSAITLEIPPFDHLQNLERIVLSCIPAIDSIPDLAPIKDLKSLAVSDRGAWCCNGFLGTCDLTNPNCGVHPLWGSPAVTCTDKLASAATLTAVDKFDATTCGPVLLPGVLEGPPTPELMAPCNVEAMRMARRRGGDVLQRSVHGHRLYDKPFPD
ncbi:unnamed protein product [Phytophthora fragariaefolia]|uniref:Unnamed protein product n=1 Tax=Phytophthora fragariaefolia TaxID=1490495 RepID=A0A9W6XMH1_9STRA|nr:unnamed protein product [Phytophthora fragariaefolia]